MAYRFPNADGLAALVRRLEETRGRGQLVGPHGSGKSTLLATLLPGTHDVECEVHPLEHFPAQPSAVVLETPAPRTLFAIDGFEQLGFLTRLQVKRHCRRSGCGLFVTAHRSMGLPDFIERG